MTKVSLLSIIVPVFNEETTIDAVLTQLIGIKLPEGIKQEIVVVNDASADQSLTAIEAFTAANPEVNIRVLTHPENRGKGAAIRTGLLACNGEYLVIQDADLELVPQEIAHLLQPILNNQADVVYGSRFLSGYRLGRWSSRAANKLLTKLSNLVFRIRITDMETCYKLMPTALAKNIILKEERFGFEPEITAKLAKNRALRWKEVPITYHPRTNLQGKKIGWKDGFRAVWCIVKYGWLTGKKGSYRA